MDPRFNASGFANRIGAWAQHPFKSEMDLMDLGLTAIFLTTVVFGWLALVNYIVPSEE